jgi:hypothetical protein
MGFHCFICGRDVDIGEKALFLTTEHGEFVNAIHEECYHNACCKRGRYEDIEVDIIAENKA